MATSTGTDRLRALIDVLVASVDDPAYEPLGPS